MVVKPRGTYMFMKHNSEEISQYGGRGLSTKTTRKRQAGNWQFTTETKGREQQLGSCTENPYKFVMGLSFLGYPRLVALRKPQKQGGSLQKRRLSSTLKGDPRLGGFLLPCSK